MAALSETGMPATNWRKARHSMANGNCVEAASILARVAVRDSAAPGAAVITCATPAWRAFVAALQAGSADRS